MKSLHGKRVVVVGGTSGLGRCAAVAARDAGAEVIVAGRRDGADQIVDVTSEASVRALFERVGKLDDRIHPRHHGR